MSKHFNAIIADQRVIFRGSSTVGISTSTLMNFRSISGAVYVANVTGGVSGSFGVNVLGRVGGITRHLAGVSAIGAGVHVLYPATYAAAGTLNAIETALAAATHRLDQTVVPTEVLFEAGGAANAIGISATISVSACIQSD